MAQRLEEAGGDQTADGLSSTSSTDRAAGRPILRTGMRMTIPSPASLVGLSDSRRPRSSSGRTAAQAVERRGHGLHPRQRPKTGA